MSTLADQVGACTSVLQPLRALVEAHVLGTERSEFGIESLSEIIADQIDRKR